MSEVILDASALLCVLRREPGADVVRPHLYGGIMSTVNLGEVMFHLFTPTKPLEQIVQRMRGLQLRLVDFGFDQAAVATSLHPFAKPQNLSYADRACLALGIMKQLPVLTTDRAWGELNLGIEIRVVR